MSIPVNILRAIHEVWFGAPPDESTLREREAELLFVLKLMATDDVARLEKLCPESRDVRPPDEQMPAVSAERIREIEQRALKRLRWPGQSKKP